jgi:hypothetical protein
LKAIFGVEKSLRVEPSDDDFVTDLLVKFGATPPFIDIVSRRQSIQLKELFLTRLTSIDLSSGATPNTYLDTFEFKVIKMISDVGDWISKFKNKITIDEKPLDQFNYNESIKVGEFLVNLNFQSYCLI